MAEETKPKVLVPEKVSPDGLALLRETLDVHEKKGLSAEELLKEISEYDALIVRSETKVTSELLAAASKLKVVARAGVGVDNVDVAAATKLGIIVVNSPSGNINAAAEHTIALMMSVARNVPDACASLKGSKWERSKFTGVELKGKTLGIIGLGKVGLRVARCAIGIGMSVKAMDPYASQALADAASVTMVPNLDELLKVSDFLTIHTPLMASTKGMIGKAELAKMKKGARVLNVARGGVYDEEALLEALESGHIAGAGVDVFTSEPPAPDSPAAKLIAHPKLVSTPHLGASTVEAQENVSMDVCEQVISILNGDLPRSAVNAPMILPEEYNMVEPFVRLVEKMGSLYTQFFSAQTNDFDGPRSSFELIYEGSLTNLKNTKPLFAALIKGLTTPISDVNVNIVNAELVAQERGISVSEQRDRSPPTHSYSALVTLRAKVANSRAPSYKPTANATLNGPASPSLSTTMAMRSFHSNIASGTSRSEEKARIAREHVISGYVAGGECFISRLGRYATGFAPEGFMLIVQNYDSPGKIGRIGLLLGGEEVNINSMAVAQVHQDDEIGPRLDEGAKAGREALMILGVDREVEVEVLKKLKAEEGILTVTSVGL